MTGDTICNLDIRLDFEYILFPIYIEGSRWYDFLLI